jgi:hypothetical protein
MKRRKDMTQDELFAEFRAAYVGDRADVLAGDLEAVINACCGDRWDEWPLEARLWIVAEWAKVLRAELNEMRSGE